MGNVGLMGLMGGMRLKIKNERLNIKYCDEECF